MIANHTWWRLTIDGIPYLDKPPLFFALLRLYVEAIGRMDEAVLLLVVPVTGLALLAATRFFLSAAGLDRATIRLSCLVLLSFPAMALHLNYFRMDLLFAALILASTGALLLGVKNEGFSGLTIAGGGLAALAALVKGPLGILFPFATIVTFELATRRPGQLRRVDLAVAAVIAVAPFAAWLAMVAHWLGPDALGHITRHQVVDRVVGHTDQSYPWWYFLVALAPATLPWMFLAPASAGLRAVRSNGSEPASAGEERTVILSYFGVVLLTLSLIAHKSAYYLPMLLPPLAALAAMTLTRLECLAPERLIYFYGGVAILSVAAPIAAALAIRTIPHEEIIRLGAVLAPADLIPFGIALALCAVPFLAAARLKGAWRVAGNIATAVILIVATKAFLLPKANDFLSAKPIIARLDKLVPDDEPLFLYRAFYGALLYYYDHPQHYTTDEAHFRQLLAEDPAPHYVMMPAAIYENDPKWQAEFKPIGSFGILLQRTLLLKSTDGSDRT
jgi:4-amino-4-deoxy-L-arabinose transferase-like glycosyltransferase